jgi:uncharacterized protein (DUF58 family)
MRFAGTARAERFLDPGVLARIANLQLAARTVVEGFIAGLHRSPQYGLSPEFAEYRPYTPGDDPRSVDWNVFARTDRYYIKKYPGETNMRVYIALDVSRSMGYRSGALTKLEYGSLLAASLAYFAIRQRDAAGLILFDTEIREFIPPRLRPGQMSQMLRALEAARPGRGTDLCSSLDKLAQFVRRRSLVAIISDLYEEPERLSGAFRRVQFGRNDLMVFHVLDPNEVSPDLRDAAVLEDLETRDRMDVAPAYVQREYCGLIRRHMEQLRLACRDSRLDYLMMNTAQPLDEALFNFLSLRQRKS